VFEHRQMNPPLAIDPALTVEAIQRGMHECANLRFFIQPQRPLNAHPILRYPLRP